MFTIIWLITFLNLGNTTLAIGDLRFWGLIVAVIADIFFVGYGRRWYFRP